MTATSESSLVSSASTERAHQRMTRFVRAGVTLSFAAFLLSLVLPVIDIGDGDPAPGAIYLAIGALGPILGYAEWLANPILIVANFNTLAGRFKTGFVCGLIAFVLMAAFHFRGEMLVNEAGLEVPVRAYLSGYWSWIVAGMLSVLAPCLPFISEWLGWGE
jgi:hypothetical protein